jgi:pimeloyl-ACP methyl ester carboxylesterase
MEQVEVEGLRIAYERAGAGPPLVLLHGYVGDGPTLWRRQLDELCDQFTVVAWDAPGAGGSADPPESFGLAGYADCLAGFIQRLGLEEPHVAGLSFGGILALALCGRHPEIPATLILASAYAGDRDVRAPLTVAEDLHASIRGSTLVVLPDAGHLGSIEAPAEFNRAVRAFLSDRRS